MGPNKETEHRTMSTYLVTEEDDEDDQFSTGVVLGRAEAPNPETALYKVCRMMVDDSLLEMEEGFQDESIINIAMWVLDYAAGDTEEGTDELRNVRVYNISAEYSEEDLQLEL